MFPLGNSGKQPARGFGARLLFRGWFVEGLCRAGEDETVGCEAFFLLPLLLLLWPLLLLLLLWPLLLWQLLLLSLLWQFLLWLRLLWPLLLLLLLKWLMPLAA